MSAHLLSILGPWDGVAEGSQAFTVLGLAGDLEFIVIPMIVLGVLIAVLLGMIIRQIGQQGTHLAKLDSLENLDEIHSALAKMREDRADLDLRRLEHVLVDIRDGNKRLEEKLLRTMEHAAAEKQVAAGSQRPPNRQPGLGERVVNRLLALGYSEVQIVTDTDELAELGEEGASGEVIIEVRRDGSHFKGRVHLRDGIIADVAITPAYNMFP